MAVTISGSGQLPTQIVQIVKTDVFTTSSTSFVDITGLSATITPRSASNRILVIISAYAGPNGSNFTCFGKLVRGATDIAIGDARGSATRASFSSSYPTGNNSAFWGLNFLDSPATTSPITYKVQAAAESGSTLTLGGSSGSGNSFNQNTPIILTLMEIAYA
jgi:hypothetical protein